MNDPGLPRDEWPHARPKGVVHATASSVGCAVIVNGLFRTVCAARVHNSRINRGPRFSGRSRPDSANVIGVICHHISHPISTQDGAAITCEIVRARSGAVKALRCAPTTRCARGSRASIASAFVKSVAWREALTAPRPERIASGNYVTAAGMRCVQQVCVQATANSMPSSIRRDPAYSMCSTRRRWLDAALDDA